MTNKIPDRGNGLLHEVDIGRVGRLHLNRKEADMSFRTLNCNSLKQQDLVHIFVDKIVFHLNRTSLNKQTGRIDQQGDTKRITKKIGGSKRKIGRGAPSSVMRLSFRLKSVNHLPRSPYSIKARTKMKYEQTSTYYRKCARSMQPKQEQQDDIAKWCPPNISKTKTLSLKKSTGMPMPTNSPQIGKVSSRLLKE
ncbi:hypothetical protein CR513_52076, partial [Mucuna pruriens]